MATRPKASRSAAKVSAALATAHKFARPFLPTLDFVEGKSDVIDELSSADKKQIIATKVADVTHFRVGLYSSSPHMAFAQALRVTPKPVRGPVRTSDGNAAARVSVQPEIPGSNSLVGRGLITDESGAF